MKYYIGYPISFNCNFRCYYCFNNAFYNYIDKGIGNDCWRDNLTFTFKQYRFWREKHLSNGTEFIMHLFGGEPFCNQNKEDVFEIIENIDKEKVDLLTNGCGSGYERLKDY